MQPSAMPIHQAPETAFVVYTVLMSATTVGFGLWWLLSSKRSRGPALPLLLAGGALSSLLEPFLDNVVLVWYPPHQNLGAYHAFGRTVPIFVPIGYAWFCGGLLYLAARFLARGVSAKQVWGLLGAVAVIDFVAIGLTTWIGVMGFYGKPPLDVAGYPLWWAAFDGSDVILGGAIVLWLLPRLHGRARLWLLAIPSLVLGAVSGAVGWPITTALHSHWSAAAKLVAAAITIGLGCAIVYGVARWVARPGRDVEIASMDAAAMAGVPAAQGLYAIHGSK
ncbi:MAG: hypothetical protein ACYDHH_24215 [Solirubrobacteraceae bacterium]